MKRIFIPLLCLIIASCSKPESKPTISQKIKMEALKRIKNQAGDSASIQLDTVVIWEKVTIKSLYDDEMNHINDMKTDSSNDLVKVNGDYKFVNTPRYEAAEIEKKRADLNDVRRKLGPDSLVLGYRFRIHFRGKNAFNALVKQEVDGKADSSGKILYMGKDFSSLDWDIYDLAN